MADQRDRNDTRNYEDSVLSHMPGRGETVAAGATAAGAVYYTTHHVDDNRFFGSRDQRKEANEARVTRSEEELEIGKRQVQGGEVDVHKRVETEHVRQPVTLRREEVTIERRPVRADQASKAIGADDEIRIPITEEELVVETRAVVKEEFVIKKHMVTEDKTVEADIRKEKIDIDRSHEHDTSTDDNGRSGRQ